MKPEDIQRDDFLKEIFQAGGVEKPSADFETVLLKKIEKAKNNHAIDYKPVIGKKIWFVILSGWFAICAFVIVSASTGSISSEKSLPGFKIDFDYNKYFSIIGSFLEKIIRSFEFDSIVATSMIALIFFMIVYLVLLKTRRFSYYK